MKKLPSLNKIKEILYKGLFMKNDIIAMKLCLDMYDEYSKLNDLELYIEVIKTQLMFYYSISDTDVTNIYETFSDRIILKIDNKERALFRKKNQYIKYFKKEKNEIERLLNGNNISKFKL
jgi:hypothetical protein